MVNQSDHVAIVELPRLKERKLQARSDFPFACEEITDSEEDLRSAAPFLFSIERRSAGQFGNEVDQPRWEVAPAVG